MSQNVSPELAEVCRVIKLDIGESEHPIQILINKFQSVLLDSISSKLMLLEQLLNQKNAQKLPGISADRLSKYRQS